MDEKELVEILRDEADDNARLRRHVQQAYKALVLHWPWFLASLLLCAGAALAYLRYAEPVYSITARMLVKESSKGGTGGQQSLSDVDDLGYVSNSTGIQNEVEVLKSRLLLRDVVRDLKLYAEYRTKGRVHDPIAYDTHPFSADLDPVHLDSLDYRFVDYSQSLQMEVWRDSAGILVQGCAVGDSVAGTPFLKRVRRLPASFATELGTVTMTGVPGRELREGTSYLVTVQPPMQVATQYYHRLAAAPAEGAKTIAELSLTDPCVRRGIDVLRQLCVCYNRQANADKNEVASRTEEFINSRMAKIAGELGSTESRIESFKRANSMTGLSVDASASVQMSNEFSARLSEADSRVEMLDYLREYVNNPDNRYQIIPSNVGLTDGASTSLINSYNQAVQDRSRLLKSASEQAPQVQTLTATIDELQQSIRTALLQARRSADISRQGIRQQFAKFQGRVSAAPVQERVLNQAGRQQDVKSALYMLLLQKREENSIALAATADNGKLIDDPILERQVRPRKVLILAGAAAAGVAVPALALLVLSLFRYKVEGHDDVEQLTGLPVVGDVPVASESVKGRAGIVVHADTNNQIDEIFRSVRTNLQFMLRGGEKVVQFTSFTSGEGKTFCAANLAVSLALLGKRVVLCGLDVRKPALGKLFGISDHFEGVTSLLALDEVKPLYVRHQLRPSGVDANLDLLLAGPVPPNPAELLARDTFADIVGALRQDYDYVILDTPPVGLVSDTLTIGRQADLTVFVCRADYTPKSAFGLLNDLAAEQKLPRPCVLLNGIDMSRRKYGYYYGYGRYGKYGRYGGYRAHGTYGKYGNYGQYGQYAQSHYGNSGDDSVKR